MRSIRWSHLATLAVLGPALACLGAAAPTSASAAGGAALATGGGGSTRASSVAGGPGCGARAAALTGSPSSSVAPAPACPKPTEDLAEQGRKIFTGSGNCYTCHGADAKGTPLAPNLVSHKWINIDGSYESIAELVTTGVPHPKQHPAPMPAMGGAHLSPEQVCAVSAYVYRLSHKE